MSPNRRVAGKPPAERSALRERLEWLMLFRVVVATLLLGSALALNFNDPHGFSDPQYLPVAAVIILTYGASIAYARWLDQARNLALLVPVQLVGDAVLSAALVLLTGGIDSVFTFLYFFTIFSGAVLSGRSGGLISASASSITFVLVYIVQATDVLAVNSLLSVEQLQRQGGNSILSVVAHIIYFYAVALLSGYLAEKLGQVGSELERRTVDVRQLRALNENIVRSISSGLVTLDLEGRVSFFNPAAEAITGRKYVEVTLFPLAIVLPDIAVMVLKATRDSTLPEGRIEGSYRRPDGVVLTLGMAVSVLRDSRGAPDGHILILDDLTSVKVLEAEVSRRDHLAAIGKLSAAIAHEIRNPLASISGCVEVLARSAPAGGEDRMLMDIVVREVERLNGLIEDFLAYARPLHVARRPINLTEIAGESVRLLQMDGRMLGQVRVSLAHQEREALTVNSDPQRLQQVLLNVFRNACQAMGGQGQLRVTTALVSVGVRPVGYAAVQVDDTGPGLSEEARQRMFEPFYTTKPGGTGLGLATSHRIVEEMGGMILADNAPGGGARFVILLPALNPHGPSESPRSTSQRALGVLRPGTLPTVSPSE